MVFQAQRLKQQAGVRGSESTHGKTLHCFLVALWLLALGRTGGERPSEVQVDAEKAWQELALVLVQSHHGVQDCRAAPVDPAWQQTSRTKAGRDRLGMFQFQLI